MARSFLYRALLCPNKGVPLDRKKVRRLKVRNVFTATHVVHTSWGEGDVERTRARSTSICYLANIVEELLETPCVRLLSLCNLNQSAISRTFVPAVFAMPEYISVYRGFSPAIQRSISAVSLIGIFAGSPTRLM